MTSTERHVQTLARRRLHRVLTAVSSDAVRTHCGPVAAEAQFVFLRGPETGMVMARGRIGGSGAAFNLGDVSLTRASVRLADGGVGHAAHLGRDTERVRLVAIVDALWQDPDRQREIEERIIDPLERLVEAADARLSGEIAATKVDFFTLVRGGD